MAERLSIADQVNISAREAGPEFDPVPLTLTLSLYRAMSAFDRAHADELTPVGLSITQFNVLSVLHRMDEPLTMGELAQAVAVRSANLTAVADSLAAKDFVKRTLNPGDRRSFLVTITAKGDRFLAGFLPGHWQVLQDLMAGLSSTDRTTLQKLLDKLLRSLQNSQPATERSNGARRANGVKSGTRSSR